MHGPYSSLHPAIGPQFYKGVSYLPLKMGWGPLLIGLIFYDTSSEKTSNLKLFSKMIYCYQQIELLKSYNLGILIVNKVKRPPLELAFFLALEMAKI